jgi:hypothetical protein
MGPLVEVQRQEFRAIVAPHSLGLSALCRNAAAETRNRTIVSMYEHYVSVILQKWALLFVECPDVSRAVDVPLFKHFRIQLPRYEELTAILERQIPAVE